MVDYPIHIGQDALEVLSQQFSDATQILVLVDEHTRAFCYPHLAPYLPEHHVVEILSGEIQKHLETCINVWQAMTDHAFDRKGLVLNLGGGVIGDLGGFVASTYKRGVKFIQIPTTLLSQVDASVGGKLGVDFQGYKNHIGLFNEPQGVYIYPPFLKTLPEQELRSGFAEVIKHHLIADGANWPKLKPLNNIEVLVQQDFEALIAHSVEIKKQIVLEDPYERGARKALNFGHTLGHAIESSFLNTDQPLLHGEAIAIGMICEAYLSVQRGLLSKEALKEIEDLILPLYGHVAISQTLFETISNWAKNDKKNANRKILCTFLEGIGQFKINQEINAEDIASALNYYNAL